MYVISKGREKEIKMNLRECLEYLVEIIIFRHFIQKVRKIFRKKII